MRVSIESNIAHACEGETARYLLLKLVRGLIKWCMRNVSCTASNNMRIGEI
jgi:hypothetical protein